MQICIRNSEIGFGSPKIPRKVKVRVFVISRKVAEEAMNWRTIDLALSISFFLSLVELPDPNPHSIEREREREGVDSFFLDFYEYITQCMYMCAIVEKNT